MSKWKHGLMIAMEDHRQFADVTPLTGFNQVDQNELDAHEASAQIKQMQDTIDEASEGAEQLQAIAECLKDTKVSVSAAKIALISTESVYRRLGIHKRSVPSLESFECKIALEDIAKTAKEIWDKIVAAIRRVWERITEFFKNLFNQNKQIKNSYETAEAELDKRLEEVKEEFANSQGTQLTESKINEITKDVKFSAGSWLKNLSLEGEFDEKKIPDGLKSITECVKAYTSYIHAIVEAAGNEQKLSDIEKAFTEIGKAAEALDKKLPDLILGEYEIKLDMNHQPSHPVFAINENNREKAASKYQEISVSDPAARGNITAAGTKLCEEIEKMEIINAQCKKLFEAIDRSIKKTNPEHYTLVGPKLTAITKTFSKSTTDFLKTVNAINADAKRYCVEASRAWMVSLANASKQDKNKDNEQSEFDKFMASDEPYKF